MKKLITQLLPLSLLVLMVSCGESPKNRYNEGFQEGRAQGKTEGYEVGYDDGQADGDAAGYERAKAYFESAGYNEGKVDGGKVGYTLGYNNGYKVGYNETSPSAYSTGYTQGKLDGDADGYDRGYDDGYGDGDDAKYESEYDRGYSAGENTSQYSHYYRGYDDGKYDGYDIGYSDGESDGYDIGYSDGYDIGYSDGEWDAFSIGKSKKLKGYANLISMAHNDIIDYTKIKMPKSTRKGLVADGKVLFSESSLTNKDTMKRQAVAEQYLVMEMAKQVKGKFGLSADRSLKIAKAANHFRKYSAKRALTSEDTNAYASEIIGSDFRAIEKAVDEARHGDLSKFSAVMEKAAEKNGTSPENITLLITKFFI
ncbi:hypothetical protein ACJVC5_17535 [Peredibacter sp. HCB2-198]|uniref:hypothetical protein n=1 Tax=Peredibacter sp. HCB2-198 TaxID=3383025 RepID=UPI0038B65E37